ncbi:MAG TPA: redoxin domain-containing protein, partial [Opitutaceae bacterium]
MIRSLEKAPVRAGAACAALLLFLLPAARADTARGARSAWWHGLGIHDLRGAPLDPDAKWFVVVYMSQECPVSNESIPVLNRLSAEFAPRGFVLVGAYVDPTADLGTLRAHVSDYAVAFPTADDRGHRLVKAARATYTPEVAV